uniref:Immunoglobulin domain-containing protein n=1 Tax=Cyprinus carpio TaxID=7962 RepID=A0A8C1XKR8_CYPCA
MFDRFWFCLCLWRLVGILGDDAVKSVSVMEGDYVTLESGVSEIQTYDLITWTFGNSQTLIARINKEDRNFNTYYYGADERFRDRLRKGYQTGSLIITDIKTTDSGLYEVTIRNRSSETKYRFKVKVFGVFGDAVKTLFVKERDSVTLESGVTEIQADDKITWMFGHPETLIAQINKEAGRFNIYNDGPDGRFTDRLRLENQTGSLTITNIRTTDSGLYEVTIRNRSSETKYRFSVKVVGESQLHCLFAASLHTNNIY